jgi:hypothetical protein
VVAPPAVALPAVVQPLPAAAPVKPQEKAPPAAPPTTGKAPIPVPRAPAAPAPVAIAAPPPPHVPASAVGPGPSAPPLDLAGLETRLRETKAIGMFTKLALKGQVNDLVDDFRELHGGRPRPTLVELRPPYDRLLLKVLALLQDEDPPLASAIVASREPIWNILADPARFAAFEREARNENANERTDPLALAVRPAPWTGPGGR